MKKLALSPVILQHIHCADRSSRSAAHAASAGAISTRHGYAGEAPAIEFIEHVERRQLFEPQRLATSFSY